MCFYKCHLCFTFLHLILESKLYNMIGMNFYSVDEFQKKYKQQNATIILGNMEKNM